MKKEALVPLAALAVAVAFVAVSLLVWATRGRSARLIGRKLRLGALLLTLTAAAGCGDGLAPQPTCYDVAATDTMRITDDDDSDYRIVLSRTGGHLLHGVVEERVSAAFSYWIKDADGVVAQEGDLAAQDGAFDEPTEDFQIAVRADLAVGVYLLELFPVALVDARAAGWPAGRYDLEIVE